MEETSRLAHITYREKNREVPARRSIIRVIEPGKEYHLEMFHHLGMGINHSSATVSFRHHF